MGIEMTYIEFLLGNCDIGVVAVVVVVDLED